MDEPGKTYRVRKSQAFTGICIVLMQILTLVAMVLFLTVLGYFQNTTGSEILPPAFVVVVLLLADVAITTYIVIDWYRTEYIFEPDSIIIKKGILGLKEDIHKTSDVDTVHVIQSPLGRLLNYGTIQFHRMYQKEDILLINVPDPQRYADIIEARRGGP